MKKLLVIPFLFLAIACGSKVEIPPAHVGKILTKNGYAPETIPPSKFRLPACWAYCDKLILLETADKSLKEEMQLFMPKDKLNISIDVRGTISVRNDEKTVNAIYDRVTAGNYKEYSSPLISVGSVYNTYGKQAIRGIVRSELTKYTIGDILSNREVIGQNIHEAISKKLAESKTPLIVSRFELANIQPPAVIVNAQEAAKEREIAVQRANADAQVKLVEAEKDLEIARKERLVAKERALAIAEQNKIAAKSVTPQLLEYRRLEVTQAIMEKLASSQNNGLIVVPMDMRSLSSTTDSAVFSKLLGKELKK